MRSKGKRVMEKSNSNRYAHKERSSNRKTGAFGKLIIVALFLFCVGFVINVAPNFIKLCPRYEVKDRK